MLNKITRKEVRIKMSEDKLMKRSMGRVIAVGYYGFQEVRMKFKNQIRDIIYKKDNDIPFDVVEEKKEKKNYGNKYTDKELVNILTLLEKNNKINPHEHKMLSKCQEMIKDTIRIENNYRKLMGEFVKDEPIFIEFLNKVRGVAMVLSANLIKEFGDCSKFKTVSKMWKYSGNHTVNGFAPVRKKGEKLGYSANLKMLTWKISDSLLKSNKGYYRELYLNEKKKQSEKEFEIGYLAEHYNGYKEPDIKLLKGHAHNRALRKTRKHFLSHFWEASRELAGLSVEKTYVEGVLKHEHIIHWKDVLKMENKLLKPKKA